MDWIRHADWDARPFPRHGSLQQWLNDESDLQREVVEVGLGEPGGVSPRIPVIIPRTVLNETFARGKRI